MPDILTPGRATTASLGTPPNVNMTSPNAIKHGGPFTMKLQFTGDPTDAAWDSLKNAASAYTVTFFANRLSGGAPDHVALGTAPAAALAVGVDSYTASISPATTPPGLTDGLWELGSIVTFAGTALLSGFAGDALCEVFA
jgi:hypothetical protein